MSQTTILMVGNYLPSPKYNKNIWHFLAERLSSQGWNVITTSSRQNLLLRLFDMLSTVWRYRHIYKIAQIDVFSGKAFIFSECCSWLLNKLNKPIVLTLHGGGLADFANSHPERVRRVFQRALKIITPSPFLQGAMQNYHPGIHFIPNPIDISSAIVRIRENPQPVLIWVRAFHQIYNPSLAVKVVKILASDFPDLHLLMIGPDKGDGSLNRFHQEAVRLGVDKRIEIIGAVSHEDIPVWLDIGDVFLNTTNYDAAPRSVLEAMANGLCVVSTNVGGMPYIIEDGVNGLLVPPDEPKLLSDAVRTILTNQHLAVTLSKNAHQEALKHDWSLILPQWETLLKGLLNYG